MINTLEETKDTVLHEIAHDLTGPGHGHDGFWKQKCLLVGAGPERCYSSKNKGGNVNTLEGKYKLIHKTTGKVYQTYHRKPKKKITGKNFIFVVKRQRHLVIYSSFLPNNLRISKKKNM